MHPIAQSLAGVARLGISRVRNATGNPSFFRLFKNAGKLQLHRLFSTAIAGIQIAVVARFLSPHDYGIYALILNTVQIVQGVLDVRCSELILKYYFQYQHEGRTRKSAAVLLLGGLFEVAVCGAGAVGLALSSRLLASTFLGTEGDASLFLLAALVPVSNMGSGLAASILSIERSYGRLAIADSISTIAGFAVLLAILPFASSIGLLLGVALFTQAARGALRWHFVLTEASPARSLLFTAVSAPSCIRELKEDARELAKFALANNFSAFLKILQGSVPNFIIGLMSGPIEVGYYFLGQRLGVRLGSFCAPVLDVAFREIAEHRMAGAGGMKKRSLVHGVMLISASLAPVFVGIVVLGPWTIPLVFGASYAGSVLPVQIVVATYIVALVLGPFGSLLLAEGKIGWINGAFALGLIFQLSALCWLVPTWSSTGAAIALAVFYFVTDAVIVYRCYRLRTRREPG